jgi:hypothetical protein
LYGNGGRDTRYETNPIGRFGLAVQATGLVFRLELGLNGEILFRVNVGRVNCADFRQGLRWWAPVVCRGLELQLSQYLMPS